MSVAGTAVLLWALALPGAQDTLPRVPGNGFNVPIPPGFVVDSMTQFGRATRAGGGVVFGPSRPVLRWRQPVIAVLVRPRPRDLPPLTEDGCRRVAGGMASGRGALQASGLVELNGRRWCRMEWVGATDHLLNGDTLQWMVQCMYDSQDERSATACDMVVRGWRPGAG